MYTRPVPVRWKPLCRNALGTPDGLDGQVWYFLPKKGDRYKEERDREILVNMPVQSVRAPETPERVGASWTGIPRPVPVQSVRHARPPLYIPLYLTP
jgi:hypothetical protein